MSNLIIRTTTEADAPAIARLATHKLGLERVGELVFGGATYVVLAFRVG